MSILHVTSGDEASLRAQCLAAVYGDAVLIPPNAYNLTNNDLKVVAGVTLMPDLSVAGAAGRVRIIRDSTHGRHGLLIDNNNANTQSRLTVRDIDFLTTLAQPAFPAAPNACLNGIEFTGNATKAMSRVSLENVGINGYRVGVNFDNSPSGIGAYFEARKVDISGIYNRGMILKSLSMATVYQCEFNTCGLNGFWANACGNLVVDNCASEGNNTQNDPALEGAAQFLIKLCHGFEMRGCDVESLPTNALAAKVGVAISRCFGGSVSGFNVIQTGNTFFKDSRGIYLMGGSRGQARLAVTTQFITTPIDKDAQSVFPNPEAMFSFQTSPYTESTAGLFNP